VSTDSRYIPQWLKDFVYRRDGGRCTYETSDGCRCCATTGLEYDHVVPVALGGRATKPEDVRLRCRAHNRLAAEEIFGAGYVASAIAAARVKTNSSQDEFAPVERPAAAPSEVHAAARSAPEPSPAAMAEA
jgi:hypothetical protein